MKFKLLITYSMLLNVKNYLLWLNFGNATVSCLDIKTRSDSVNEN